MAQTSLLQVRMEPALIDTDFILDFLTNREPFFEDL